MELDKNADYCISSLEDTAGDTPQIDFGECYNKVKIMI